MQEANEDCNFVNFLFADCEQLEQWRKDKIKSLNDYGYSLTPKKSGYKELEYTNKEYVIIMEKALKKYTSKKFAMIIKSIERISHKHFKNLKINKSSFLGVLGKDNYAVYIGLLMKINTEDNKTKILVGVSAMTLVNKVAMNLYLWKEYKGKRTIYDLQDIMTLWIQRIHS